MSLTIRYDAKGGVLRSLGDEPLGVVGVQLAGDDDTEPGFMVHSRGHVPPPIRHAGTSTQPMAPPPAMQPRIIAPGTPHYDSAEPVDVVELLEGCVGGTERAMVWMMACRSLHDTVCGDLQRTAETRWARAWLDIVEQVRDWLIDQGHTSP